MFSKKDPKKDQKKPTAINAVGFSLSATSAVKLSLT